MLPNSIPDRLLDLLTSISQQPYLKNYQNLKTMFGSNCVTTKKAADIFIFEHKEQLEALRKALHELKSIEEVSERSGHNNSTGQTG